jgi:hypothetical protein
VVILQARFLRGPDFPERMTGRFQQRLAEDLDLSAAQQQAIAQAMKASSEEMRELHAEMDPARAVPSARPAPGTTSRRVCRAGYRPLASHAGRKGRGGGPVPPPAASPETSPEPPTDQPPR